MVGLTTMALVLGLAAGWVALQAVRSGHLLVFRGPDRPVRIYERRPDGCYGPVPPARVHRALWRFVRKRREPLPVLIRTPGGRRA